MHRKGDSVVSGLLRVIKIQCNEKNINSEKYQFERQKANPRLAEQRMDPRLTPALPLVYFFSLMIFVF
jgi:hypothetical protein